ncbi:Proteasome lid subunit RPN8/RPN11, contains Jab1/MPN metalloenzyme (JAMM) motif [Stigmatella aurantiaca]|uniref:Proteasome lid subunit RPN8/RPN11, contains Jab1/MPN metalloenzyme (JAMM) motif n=2 Tax=Stigmatella aurantiaca TaxID=41 RepID=A0A1H7J507_STIAU|nr:Proteasome lid subunit RPN8/RPN11, contains Jab1/MPN metalloenzyme (JAMM) motif [Stigmatella aurantiaca]
MPGDALPEDLSEVLRHLEACYPLEGCGVLLRTEAGDWRVRPLFNAYDRYHAADPGRFPRSARTAFLFEPQEWLAVNREADARNEQVACLFHSHVEGVARLSAEDRLAAAPGGIPLFPGVSYLVVNVVRGRAAEAREYRWAGGEFQDRKVPL